MQRLLILINQEGALLSLLASKNSLKLSFLPEQDFKAAEQGVRAGQGWDGNLKENNC